MDYDREFEHGDISSFIRFIKTDTTQSWFGKIKPEEADDTLNNYSGTNITLDIIPLKYIRKIKKPMQFNAVIFGIENDNLQVVVFDNNESLPISDAKIFVYDANGTLLLKKGSDRYGRLFIRNLLKDGETVNVKITYDNEERNTSFVFAPDMEGICLY